MKKSIHTLILGGTIKYLTKYGYDRNPLQQVRDGVKAAEADNANMIHIKREVIFAISVV